MKKVFWLVAVLAGLFALLRSLPLAWVTAGVPDTVGTFSGTVWDGQVSGVPLLGSATVKTGPSGARIATPPGDVSLSARLRPGTLNDVSFSMPLARLPMQDARLAGLAGRVSLQIDEARITDDACLSASGTASTDALVANAARLGFAGPVLSGPVDCVDGRLRVRLSGEDAQARVEALTTTGLDGVYQSDITVTARDPNAGTVLGLFGFAPTGQPGEYRLSERGRWR